MTLRRGCKHSRIDWLSSINHLRAFQALNDRAQAPDEARPQTVEHFIGDNNAPSGAGSWQSVGDTVSPLNAEEGSPPSAVAW